MLNASGCTGSHEMLIHLRRTDLENENKFLTNQINKRSHGDNGGVTSHEVDKDNKK